MSEADRHFPDESRPRYLEPNPDVDRVDMLKNRLYSRVDPLARRRNVRLKPIESDAKTDWGDEPDLRIRTDDAPKRNPFIIVFSIAMLFFLGAAAYAGLVWYGRLPNTDGSNVVLEIIGPTTVKGGDPVALEVVIANRNNVEMEFVDVVLEFPEGTKSEDLSRDVRREILDIGKIAPGGVVKRDVEVVLYGSEQSIQNILARVTYRLPGSVSIYDREKPFSLTLTKSPLSTLTKIVKEVTSGQIVVVDVEIASNSERAVEGALLRVDYPFGFEVLEEQGTRFGGPGTFDLGSFAPGEKKSVKITGRMTGANGEEKTFKVSSGVRAGSEDPTFAATFSTDLSTLTVVQPFLNIAFSVASSEDETVAVNPERGLRGFFTITNNLDVEVVNVSVEGRIDGDVIAEEDITPTLGFYRSADNTLVWDKSTARELASMQPGDELRLGFSFGINRLYNEETEALFRNPEMFLKMTARGRRVSERDVPEDIVNTVERVIKINSQVGLTVDPTYSIGPFQNSGPLPPQPEKPTTYTINLDIDNTSNALADAVFTAKLPPHVEWMDSFAPRDEQFLYDPADRKITWRVGDVPAGAGYSAPSVEAAFQLSLFPSLTQVQNDADLLLEPTLQYYDRFTGQNLQVADEKASTKIETDPLYRPGIEVVTNP